MLVKTKKWFPKLVKKIWSKRICQKKVCWIIKPKNILAKQNFGWKNFGSKKNCEKNCVPRKFIKKSWSKNLVKDFSLEIFSRRTICYFWWGIFFFFLIKFFDHLNGVTNLSCFRIKTHWVVVVALSKLSLWFPVFLFAVYCHQIVYTQEKIFWESCLWKTWIIVKDSCLRKLSKIR